MTNDQKIRLRLSQVRGRLNDIAGIEDLTDEIRSEAEALHTELNDLSIRERALIPSEGITENRDTGLDAEARERNELRSRARVTSYILAALSGRQVDGAEAELRDAAGVSGVPLELWDTAPAANGETRQDAATVAPGTVGVNLDAIRPQVFSASIAPRLGIEMPRVESGSYASATISTSLTAAAQVAGADAHATAAGFTVTSVTPKRISARLGIRVEDVAAVGQVNFESILRENLSLVLSDALDSQMINGDGSSPNLSGIFARLTAPSDPTTVADFDAFASAHAGGIDGLWSNTLKEVSVVCGPATMALTARTFQTATSYKGELSSAAYAMANTGGLWTNRRMPDAASDVQQAVLYRMGRSMMGGAGAMRTAVCPHWNEISIDDIYSGSASGERFFTMHVLLGDVILVQPDAYSQIAYLLA